MASTVPAADKPKPKPVKETTEAVAGTHERTGVVAHIDADGMTLVEIVDGGEPKEYQFSPVDRLRNKEVLDNVSGMYAYRWQDVKKGDTVAVEAMEDKAEGKVYCLKICIHRRPGEKLPESQSPKRDHRYAWDRIYNDLTNGEDVSDADILKAFPAQPEYRGPDGKVLVPAYPAGLPRDWQVKLDAIRAKKKDELKAKPPEKKDDKK
jgi:hypothetical protein